MKRLRRIFLARAATTLALAVLTTVGAWAQEAPTGLSVSNVSPKTADLGWNASDGVESYTVRYRETYQPGGFIEQFKSGVPSSWNSYEGLLSEVMEGTTSLSAYNGWYMTSYALGAYNARVNIYSDNCRYWLVSPSVEIADGDIFRFDTALTGYENSDPATSGDDDRFVVLITTDDGNSWKILREWNNAGSSYVLDDIPATGQAVYDISISSYVGKTVRIAFYVESTVSGNDVDLHIDNVFIGVPAEWQTTTATTNSVTLTGLTRETEYEAQVQCGSDGQWSDAVSFTTTTFMGLGTEDSPYMINDTEDLDMLAECVNAGSDFYGCYFKQGADIAYDPTVLTKDDGKSNFTAIGNTYDNYTYHYFNGHFDGAGKTISGIVICKDDDINVYPNCYQALFGLLNSNGEVCNVHLVNSSFTGGMLIGGIVGWSYGNLHDCFASGITINANHAICGVIAGNSYNYPERCYYYNCTVNGVENATGVGCAGADYTSPIRVVSVNTLTLDGENISTSTTPTVTVDGTGYYARGTTINLSCSGVEVPDGEHIYYYVNGQEIDEDNFPMPAEDVTVTYSVESAHVNIGTSGWASYYHEDDVTYSVAEGAQAFYVSGVTDEAVVLTPIDGIPSGLPVLVNASGEKVALTSREAISAPTDASANFHGTASKLSASDYGAETLDGHYVKGLTYVLSGGKFHLVDTNRGIRPNRCWLTLDAPAEARLSLVINDDATGIASVPSATGVESWYDLQGRRLNGEPTRHGLYIYKGKKVKK